MFFPYHKPLFPPNSSAEFPRSSLPSLLPLQVRAVRVSKWGGGQRLIRQREKIRHRVDISLHQPQYSNLPGCSMCGRFELPSLREQPPFRVEETLAIGSMEETSISSAASKRPAFFSAAPLARRAAKNSKGSVLPLQG